MLLQSTDSILINLIQQNRAMTIGQSAQMSGSARLIYPGARTPHLARQTGCTCNK
jgi:hypothetical protein